MSLQSYYAKCGVPKPKKVVRRKRSTGLQRTRMKKRGPRTKKSHGALFPKRRDYAYLAWAVGDPCLLRDRAIWRDNVETLVHVCLGPVQVCHVKSRGAGGADDSNVVAMCAAAHDEQHRLGIRSFQKRWDIDLKAEAASLWTRYKREAQRP